MLLCFGLTEKQSDKELYNHVEPGRAGSCRIGLGRAGLGRVVPGRAGSCRVMRGRTGSYRVVPGHAMSDRIVS